MQFLHQVGIVVKTSMTLKLTYDIIFKWKSSDLTNSKIFIQQRFILNSYSFFQFFLRYFISSDHWLDFDWDFSFSYWELTNIIQQRIISSNLLSTKVLVKWEICRFDWDFSFHKQICQISKKLEYLFWISNWKSFDNFI